MDYNRKYCGCLPSGVIFVLIKLPDGRQRGTWFDIKSYEMYTKRLFRTVLIGFLHCSRLDEIPKMLHYKHTMNFQDSLYSILDKVWSVVNL